MSEEHDSLLGELAVTRATLEKVFRSLPDAELDILCDQLSETHDDLAKLWAKNPNAHQKGTMEAYERLAFRLRHREKFWPSKDPTAQKPYFICRKCEGPIIHSDLEKLTCRACGTHRWIELVYA